MAGSSGGGANSLRSGVGVRRGAPLKRPATRPVGPGGALPVNTGGGQLSSFYMWGMTPVSEAVIQMRGEGGERQVSGAKVALVSGNGGILSTHSTLVLSNQP